MTRRREYRFLFASAVSLGTFQLDTTGETILKHVRRVLNEPGKLSKQKKKKKKKKKKKNKYTKHFVGLVFVFVLTPALEIIFFLKKMFKKDIVLKCPAKTQF